MMNRKKIIECHYYTQFPQAKCKGKLFSIKYRKLSRCYELFQDGRLVGRFKHSDFALLEILRITVGIEGDELPAKHAPLMKELEKRFLISYIGFENG